MSQYVAYTDTDQPGSLYVFERENPDLEARPNFDRVDVNEIDIPQSTLNALARKRAERQGVQDATEGKHAVGAVEAAHGTVTAPVHYKGDIRRSRTGVLSAPGVDAVQIGPNPELHNNDPEVLRARAEYEVANNAHIGVLSDPTLTLQGGTGNGQIGDHPEEHPQTRGELLDAAAAGSDGTPITRSGRIAAGMDPDQGPDYARDRGQSTDQPTPTAGGGTPTVANTPGDEHAAGPIVDDPAATPAKRAPAKAATKATGSK